jgi:ABC-2 type transport system permease protein
MYLSVVTVLCMAPGVIALGIGLGAAYPDFGSENPAQSVTSFGGLMFMILSSAFIGIVIILEAGPVYTVFMADIRGWTLSCWQHVWIVGSFIVALIVSVLAVLLPMRYGAKRLDRSSQLTISAQLA